MVDKDKSISSGVKEAKTELARRAAELQLRKNPDLEERYGNKGRQKCIDDAINHLNYLVEAIRVGNINLFTNYLKWADIMLHERGIPANDLITNIKMLQEAAQENLPSEISSVTERYINSGIETLKSNERTTESFILSDNPLQKEAEQYLSNLLKGQRDKAAAIIDKLIENQISVADIYEYIFQVTLQEVGRLWQTNRISVAHEHYCTAATQLIMSRLYPHIFSTEKKGVHLVACSVGGELHEMGIRMVSDFFEMDGWHTYYLGANMPDDDIIQALFENNADLIAISVTLSMHVGRAEELIQKIRAKEELKKVKIMVGGYPFSIEPDLWQTIGADATAKSAKEAVAIANNMVHKR